MDWGLDYLHISKHDLNTVFKYEQNENTVFRMLASDKEPSIKQIFSQSDWEAWFKEGMFPRNSTDAGVILILGRRAVKQESTHKETILRYLPFSKTIFSRIAKSIFIHQSITRVISRGDDAVFSRSYVEVDTDGGKRPAIVYNCRSANSWGRDMALSVTFFPETCQSYAILLGCTTDVETQVLARLQKSGQAVVHPMTLPGIFAELEQNRHLELVEESIDALESKILNLDEDPEDASPKATGNQASEFSETNGDGTIEIWLDTSYLRNGLHNWKAQLLKMASHSNELSTTLFKTDETSQESNHLDEAIELSRESNMDHLSPLMRKWGLRLEDGLRDNINKYDEKIRDCTIRVDGMTTATQLSHTRTNMQIALAAKQDGSQMKSIAFLTMVFLPPTFVATLFSMSIFNWFPDKGKGVVSPYLWIYITVTSTLTLATVGLWFFLSIYRRKRQNRSF